MLTEAGIIFVIMCLCIVMGGTWGAGMCGIGRSLSGIPERRKVFDRLKSRSNPANIITHGLYSALYFVDSKRSPQAARKSLYCAGLSAKIPVEPLVIAMCVSVLCCVIGYAVKRR